MKFLTIPNGVLINLATISSVDPVSHEQLKPGIRVVVGGQSREFWNDETVMVLDALEQCGVDVNSTRDRTGVKRSPTPPAIQVGFLQKSAETIAERVKRELKRNTKE